MKEPAQDKILLVQAAGSKSSCSYSLGVCKPRRWKKLEKKDWGELTDPNADADDHGNSWGAVAKRFQGVDSDVAAVSAHRCQSDAGGLNCHLREAT